MTNAPSLASQSLVSLTSAAAILAAPSAQEVLNRRRWCRPISFWRGDDTGDYAKCPHAEGADIEAFTASILIYRAAA